RRTGRRNLPPRRRHAGAERGGSRRAIGGRLDLVLPGALLRFPSAFPHRAAPPRATVGLLAPVLRGPLLRLPPAIPRPPGRAMSAVAELRAVGFEYPAGHAAARARDPFSLREVSLGGGPGEIVGVIGPNASGKTTLIRLLSGLLRPTRGEILLEGQSLARLTRAAVATRVGVVPQDVPRDFPYTVEELVLMGRFPHAPGRFFESVRDRRVAAEAMALVGVQALAGERCDRLSGGERQRVMLARALAQEPRLLVLDEPTAHLELRYQARRARHPRAPPP